VTTGPGTRDRATWSAILSVRMPRITIRGEVESAAVAGLREDVMSPDEADALADALRDFAAEARAADEAVTPHLRAAIEAGRALDQS